MLHTVILMLEFSNKKKLTIYIRETSRVTIYRSNEPNQFDNHLLRNNISIRIWSSGLQTLGLGVAANSSFFDVPLPDTTVSDGDESTATYPLY